MADDSTKQQSVETLVETAANTAANWIHSPEALSAMGKVTGLAPLFIQFGFMLAHMLQNHAEKHGIAVPQIAGQPNNQK